MELRNGSKIGIVGGGPAGAMTAYFMLDLANRLDLELEVDIYEAKDFSKSGPAGCNMCGGIISESLVQMLATEGINIPASVVERGIESYVLHSAGKEVTISTPLDEQRIASMYRGSGPKGTEGGDWDSFDGFLLDLACKKGANLVRERVTGLKWLDGYPVFTTKESGDKLYDLAVGAVGVNSPGLKLFKDLGFGFSEPKTTSAYLCEVKMGHERIQEEIGNSMHVFLLDIPNMDFAAVIPKGEYVTICILGKKVDKKLTSSFMNAPEVKALLKMEWDEKNSSCCKCLPKISVGMAKNFYDDRVVLVGDCGVSKLYKDGIGAAYRTAKACAMTSILHGVSKEAFQKFFVPRCKKIERDNSVGKFIFLVVALFKKFSFLRKGMMSMTAKEQRVAPEKRLMSSVLWDTFTGSESYTDVFLRTIKPRYLFTLAKECTLSLFGFSGMNKGKEKE